MCGGKQHGAEAGAAVSTTFVWDGESCNRRGYEMRQQKNARADLGIVILHWGTIAALCIAFLTGLRVAADAPNREWLSYLIAIFPSGDVWSIHLLAVLGLLSVAIAYVIYIIGANRTKRVKVDVAHRSGTLLQGRTRRKAVNTALYWIFFALLLAEAVSGVLLYQGYGSNAVTLHFAGAIALLAFSILLMFMDLADGMLISGVNPDPGMVYTPQVPVFSDISIDAKDERFKSAAIGRVAEINRLCNDVFEVVLGLDQPSPHQPGQYYNLQFEGFPARAYSPTPALESADPEGAPIARFHIKHIATGQVSSHLGTAIRPGHKAKLFGPFGSACFEPGKSERLILVSGGTGFAPIWSIADAALIENTDREVVLIAAAAQVSQLYMAPALHIADQCPNVTALAITSEPAVERNWLRSGDLFHHLPELKREDIVHVAGPASLVRAVGEIAELVGCRMHADPFHATGSSRGQSVTEQPPLKFGRARKLPEPEMVPFPRRAAE